MFYQKVGEVSAHYIVGRSYHPAVTKLDEDDPTWRKFLLEFKLCFVAHGSFTSFARFMFNYKALTNFIVGLYNFYQRFDVCCVAGQLLCQIVIQADRLH